MLPQGAYDALLSVPSESLQQWEDYQEHEPIIDEYMNAKPAELLTEEEMKELYDQLGPEIVKGHYSIEQLHQLAKKEQSTKKVRRNE